VAPRYPSWRCQRQCHVNVGGMNFVSLITLFDERSPKEILDIIDTRFARKVPSKKSNGKVKPVPSKKSTGKVRPTPAKATRYCALDGAIYPTQAK
jgi:hypothetical protein